MPKGRPNAFGSKSKRPGFAKTRMRTIWVVSPTPPFEDDYTLGRQLGQPGQFGCAFRCEKKGTSEKYAVKIIGKNRFYHIERKQRNKYLHAMQSEISILRTLTHERIVKLQDVYEDKKNLYIVMEECKGGELFERIVQRGHYSERNAARVIKQVLEGLQYMHDYHRVVHCDLKPDNILFATRHKDSPIKIIDFGMSKVLPRLHSLNELVGTPYYTAPEILRGKYSHQADCWSIGVIMYVMMTGYPPFYVDPQRYGKNEAKAIYAKIKRGFQPIVKTGYGPWFPSSMPISEPARDLITRLLEMQVDRRLTAREALEHRWLGNAPMENLGGFVEKISTFTNESKFKTTIIHLFRGQFRELHRDAFNDLRQHFALIDTDNDGVISYSEFEAGLSSLDGLSSDQIRQLFENLIPEGHTGIRFEDILDAAVHDYLVANDERLYAAFRDLDGDDDGYILTRELVAKMVVEDQIGEMDTEEAVQTFIDEMGLDINGRIDYEKFLRQLHPSFNELPQIRLRDENGRAENTDTEIETNESAVAVDST